MKRFLFAFILAVFSFSFVLAQDVMVKPVDDRGYLIGPGDVISIRVFGEAEFNSEAVTVDQDGKIEIPVSEQPIVAQCRTEKDLRADVTKIMAKYLRNPMITVRVTERNSRPPAVVSGEVKSPQQVEMMRKASLLEVITFAGGVTEDSSGLVRIYRTKPPLCEDADSDVAWAKSDSDYEVPSRLYTLSSMQTGDETSNPTIFPGDLIIVEKASPIYITGLVVQPQGLRLPEGGLSLQRAIAMVGGVQREAKTKDIKIYRLKQDSQEREIISANYDLIKKGEQKDIMLEPYDIIEVDKSKKSIGQLILETVVGVGTSTLTSLPLRILY